MGNMYDESYNEIVGLLDEAYLRNTVTDSNEDVANEFNRLFEEYTNG